MDKQMIEEMEKTLYDYYFHYDDCIGGSERYLAKYLIEKGWIKPAENAVVLTNDEFWALSNKFSKKELDEIVEFHKNKTRKETAEKFAEKLKVEFDEILLSDTPLSKIDEICKETAEGKV